jgi:uncharacterized Ntn-hydrolase superfamily protein
LKLKKGANIMKTIKIPLFFIVVICISGLLAFNTNQDRSFMYNSPDGTEPSSIEPVATFSIVAFDPNTKELGIAVQSKVISVGSIVPWAKGGVGAVATQSYANTQYGPEGLKLLEDGLDPNEVIKKLTAADPEAQSRQVGIVDATGMVATFTGEKCNSWAGGRTGKYYTVQGNILAGQGVVNGMAEAFEKTKGELGTRLISALEAGQAAGGDKRGRQSAALLLVREGWGYGGFNDRYRDLRVDDNPEPIKELRRIYEIHKQVFPQPKAGNRED